MLRSLVGSEMCIRDSYYYPLEVLVYANTTLTTVSTTIIIIMILLVPVLTICNINYISMILVPLTDSCIIIISTNDITSSSTTTTTTTTTTAAVSYYCYYYYYPFQYHNQVLLRFPETLELIETIDMCIILIFRIDCNK